MFCVSEIHIKNYDVTGMSFMIFHHEASVGQSKDLLFNNPSVTKALISVVLIFVADEFMLVKKATFFI